MTLVCSFCPHDAMLSQVLAMALCPSVCVCLSLCHKSEFCQNGWMNRTGSFLPSILHCVERKFGISKNKGTSFWDIVPNNGLGRFCFGISIAETCYRHSSRKVCTQSVTDKLDRRRPTKVTVLIKFHQNNQKVIYFWRFDLYQRPSSEEAGTRSSSGSWRDKLESSQESGRTFDWVGSSLCPGSWIVDLPSGYELPPWSLRWQYLGAPTLVH